MALGTGDFAVQGCRASNHGQLTETRIRRPNLAAFSVTITNRLCWLKNARDELVLLAVDV